jgi:hypothetical protein
MENEDHEVKEAHEELKKDLGDEDLEVLFDIDLDKQDNVAHEVLASLDMVFDMDLDNPDYEAHEELDMVEYFHN